MSQEEDKSQKTEEPTPKKIQDERRKGNVPSSKEPATVMNIFALMIIVTYLSPSIAASMTDILTTMIHSIAHVQIGEGKTGLDDVGALIGLISYNVMSVIGPMFLVIIIAALFGVAIQGDIVVALKRVEPELNKISPLQGLKKMFSLNTLIEFLKSLAKVIIVIIVAYFIVSVVQQRFWQTTLIVPESIPAILKDKAALLLLVITCLIVPLAIFDIIWQRAQWTKKNRMSLKEVKDEHKDMEGDPHMKSKRDAKRKELAQKRMKDIIPKATVVLTNPTHFAVALRWEKGVDPAPIVVAKGVDRIALHIRELAKENEVPIIENKPLARTLHATTEVDDVIPNEHWQAVADIIGYVLNLKQNIKAKPPEGSELRED